MNRIYPFHECLLQYAKFNLNTVEMELTHSFILLWAMWLTKARCQE